MNHPALLGHLRVPEHRLLLRIIKLQNGTAVRMAAPGILVEGVL